jgi:hypothetical protein
MTQMLSIILVIFTFVIVSTNSFVTNKAVKVRNGGNFYKPLLALKEGALEKIADLRIELSQLDSLEKLTAWPEGEERDNEQERRR